MILDKTYFAKNAIELAPDLLGKILCRRVGDKVLRARITETECYFGEEDTACHAHRGKTPRTEVMYEEGGVSYVYLCYGMHAMLNIVTGAKEHPEAVLIRGVEGLKGPGRLTKGMTITTSDNRLPLEPESGLWLEDDGTRSPEFIATARVGIDYASPEDRARLWRYVVQ